ncbi:MAG: patatin-like phospholipase family protein [Hyphomicrobiaceae bacterium]
MTGSPADVVLDLALQGGGAHGAFTWGVLDRLLDEKRVRCAAVSGASAGAINAVVMADGLLGGGPQGAQRALWAFWKRISRAAHDRPSNNPFQALFLPDWMNPSPWSSLGPWAATMAYWSDATRAFARIYSPYQWNPLNLNPLLDLMTDQIDFEGLRSSASIRLFISATSVKTGGLRIFRNHELTPRAVMASACLPHVFQAVEIDGEAYWDGGYLGNPALLPLISESEPEDLLVVQLNPPVRNEKPRSMGGISARLNEITFNASLMKELKGIALLKQALDEENLAHHFRHPLFNQVRHLRLHRIAAEETAFQLDMKSKLDVEWECLIRLHGLGARAAEEWLRRHRDDLGRRSSLNADALA